MSMKRLLTTLAVIAIVLVPGAVSAKGNDHSLGNGHGKGNAYGHYKNGKQSYTYTTQYGNGGAYSNAYIADLIRQLQALQVQLEQLQNNNGGNYGNVYGSARSIDVEFKNSAAYVEIDYTNGRSKDLVIAADTENEVVNFLVETTDITRANILAVISYDDNDNDDNDNDNDIDDIEDINIEIDRDENEAEARVEYEDGDVDTFDYNTDDEDDIISELADDLDIDEDDVEDIADISYVDGNNNDDDVDEIDVDIIDGDAHIVVRYEDGRVTNIRYNDEDDEDDIIERLADQLDMDEDDIEDVTDFN